MPWLDRGSVARVENPPLARGARWLAGLVLALCLGPEGMINLDVGIRWHTRCWRDTFSTTPKMETLLAKLVAPAPGHPRHGWQGGEGSGEEEGEKEAR